MLASTLQQQQATTAAMQNHITALEGRLAARTSSPPPSLVDTKTLGRVDKFEGQRKDWSDWSFSVRAFIGG
eukprot:1309955-Prorocentrum_lima.AAC.1